MAYPRVATAKIVMPYTAAGRLHRIHAFVRGLTAVGGTWNINSRTLDANDIAWRDAAQGYWLSVSYMLDDAVAVPTLELWTKTGLLWTLLDTVAATGGNGSGGTTPASELTATYRCSQGEFLQVDILEGNFTPPFASRDYTAFGGAITNGLKQWTAAHTVTTAPHTWQVSQDNHYLTSTPFVKGVASYNRHLRKLAGLA